MDLAADSMDSEYANPLIAPPIPGFAPFSLLPDELILAIARHLPQIKSFLSSRERIWTEEKRSIEHFVSVDKRIRHLALSVCWEDISLRMFGWSTPLVLKRLSRYGHLVKRLVVRAFPRDWQITFQQQLDRAVACLAACHNLKIFNLWIRQPSDTGERGSLAAVFDTLAEHASKLESLFIQSCWTLDDFVHLVGAVAATTCLKSLKVFPTGRVGFDARQIPSLPCLPVLTELYVPTANLVTMTTFAGTDACQVLGLAHAQVGDLAHVAKCVGHSVDRLSILSLAPSTCEDPPPIFGVLRRLQVYYGSSVRLLALVDPATPLETLEINQMDAKVFAGLQDFYTRQPRKTLTRINISRPQSKQHDDFWMDPGPETEEDFEEEHRLKIASHQVLERCLAWAANRGITIEADWYNAYWSALETSAILA